MSGGFVLLPEPYIQEVIRCTVTGISIKLCSERTMALPCTWSQSSGSKHKTQRETTGIIPAGKICSEFKIES